MDECPSRYEALKIQNLELEIKLLQDESKKLKREYVNDQVQVESTICFRFSIFCLGSMVEFFCLTFNV